MCVALGSTAKCRPPRDPVRSIGAGKVEIGAFRTFPEGYANAAESSEWQSVPSDRIEDFGVHAKCYYQLEVSPPLCALCVCVHPF